MLYEVNDLKKKHTGPLPVEDLAASFQAAVVDVLFNKTMQAARDFNAKEILVAGGVSANRALREAFQSQDEFKVHIPAFSLCTDNAAMIAAAGYYRYALGHVIGAGYGCPADVAAVISGQVDRYTSTQVGSREVKRKQVHRWNLNLCTCSLSTCLPSP